jgi:hypothetical protein
MLAGTGCGIADRDGGATGRKGMTLARDDAWPALPLDAWRGTYATLHMWLQIVGKATLALTPLVNHFWNVAFRVTARGLATPALDAGGRALTITFDFVDHRLVLQCSDGASESIPLAPCTVADFHAAVLRSLAKLGVGVHIWTMPVEVPDPIPFETDTQHANYDASSANAFWRALVSIEPVFERFRGRFVGKCSPVHFFWGSCDLAVTRFSGRPAPAREDADPITREAYSHEVISHGFWPGGSGVEEPAFYAYAAPEPEGLAGAAVRPPAAFYSTALKEFLLPYEAVRAASAPETVLTAFLESTYDAAAELGAWNRQALERH